MSKINPHSWFHEYGALERSSSVSLALSCRGLVSLPSMLSSSSVSTHTHLLSRMHTHPQTRTYLSYSSLDQHQWTCYLKQECWHSNQITYCAEVEANSTSVWANSVSETKVRVEGDGVWDHISMKTTWGEWREWFIFHLSLMLLFGQLSLLHILLTGSPQHT